MLFGSNHGGQLAFFELSATLIPILIFSGVVAERNGPQPQDSWSRTEAFARLIPFVGAIAVFAELFSIATVVTGRSNDFIVAFVAVAFAGGLVAVILSIWFPWLAAYKRRFPYRYPGLVRGSVVILLLISAATVFLIISAVGAANSLEKSGNELRICEHRIEAREHNIQRNTRELEQTQLEIRVDTRASTEAAEHLLRAELSHAPKALIRLLKADDRQEGSLYAIDIGKNVRLTKAGGPLLKQLAKQTACLGN